MFEVEAAISTVLHKLFQLFMVEWQEFYLRLEIIHFNISAIIRYFIMTSINDKKN